MDKFNPLSQRWERDTPQREISPKQHARRIQMARILLRNAANETSRALALKMARRWGLNATEIGV